MHSLYNFSKHASSQKIITQTPLQHFTHQSSDLWNALQYKLCIDSTKTLSETKMKVKKALVTNQH